MLEKDKEKLDYIVNGLSKLPYVSVIILFGSYVNGKARIDSDIDIAVITKKSSSEHDSRILGYSSEKFEISIFNKLPLIIQFRVIRDGRLIFCRDKNYLHEIKFNVIRKYLDYSSFINNFYKRVIKNV